MWKLGDVLDLRYWQEGGLCGDEAERSSSLSARRGFGDVGRVMTRGQGHTPPVTLRKIGGGHCEELVLWQTHSGHIVSEAHLTVVRAMGWE